MSTTARKPAQRRRPAVVRGDPPDARPSARVLPARARHVRAAARPRSDHGPERQLVCSRTTSTTTTPSRSSSGRRCSPWPGLVGAVIAARMPLSVLRKLIRPFLILSILLIIATFIPGVGLEVNGNRNWLPLPGTLQLQPSEFAKLAVVLWIADLYARRHRRLGSARSILLPMVPISGGVAALVVGQRDLGTALVLFAVIVGMLWVVGLPARPMGAVVAAVSRRLRVLRGHRAGTRHPDAELPQPDGRPRQGRLPVDPRHDGVRPRRLLGRRPRRQPAEVGRTARRRTPTSSSPSSARSSA